jgi:hypothetical protein
MLCIKGGMPLFAHIQKRGICYTDQGMDSANKVCII